VIEGAHTIIFASDADRARTFFRDVLGLANIDAGDGWLIFRLPPGELAIHPGPGGGHDSAQHELFLMCHDVRATVAELQQKGVEFLAPITDAGYGLMTRFKVPGAGEIGLYEPRHPSPLPEFRQQTRSTTD
jgi:catechol 2,3-dioxygenase-like lactoylglutathione lyase family enzyme